MNIFSYLATKFNENPTAFTTPAGIAIGAGAGYLFTKDPDKKVTHSLIGGLTGGGVGLFAGNVVEGLNAVAEENAKLELANKEKQDKERYAQHTLLLEKQLEDTKKSELAKDRRMAARMSKSDILEKMKNEQKATQDSIPTSAKMAQTTLNALNYPSNLNPAVPVLGGTAAGLSVGNIARIAHESKLNTVRDITARLLQNTQDPTTFFNDPANFMTYREHLKNGLRLSDVNEVPSYMDKYKIHIPDYTNPTGAAPGPSSLKWKLLMKAISLGRYKA